MGRTCFDKVGRVGLTEDEDERTNERTGISLGKDLSVVDGWMDGWMHTVLTEHMYVYISTSIFI